MTSNASPAMISRSWYMSKALAERLAVALDDLHWRARRPKHEVLDAVIEVALAHPDEVLAKLSERAA
jgi:hypothetical protein